MKKMFFGSLLIFIGLAFSITIFLIAQSKPWDYYGITGLLGSLLGERLIVPFIVSILIILTGLIICYVEAFKKDEIK